MLDHDAEHEVLEVAIRLLFLWAQLREFRVRPTADEHATDLLTLNEHKSCGAVSAF